MERLFCTSLLTIAICLAAPAFAQAAGAPVPNDQPSPLPDAQDGRTAGADTPVDDEIVVTGTLTPTAPTSVAVSVLNAEQIGTTVPLSAADLLRNVPGVYVNSALGEIRNVVYSRGISANSSEAAGGYYYVSLQEDGLPVTNVTFNNYGPDYYYREDLSLARLEALRGGSAVVTGPNAPGGIFNYISKDGRYNPGTEVRSRVGLLGNGQNIYYRGDFITAGEAANDLYYSVSGFYRFDDGARDTGYSANRGGQFKVNLRWDYGQGTVQLYGKYLNDRNSVNQFLPATNFDDPQVASGLSWNDSLAMPRTPHQFTTSVDGKTRDWDANNLIQSTAVSVGMRNDHEFGDGWTIKNNLKFSRNKSEWNTPALVFTVPITDGFTNTILNTTQPGIYSYFNHDTGDLLARIQLANGVRTVLENNLPNQQILPGGVVTQVPFYYTPSVHEIMEQLSISKQFARGSATVGTFIANSDVKQRGGGAGVGISTLEDNPVLLDITRTTPAGLTQQVTSPEGLAGIGQRFGGTPFDTKQLQASIFAGGDYEITDALKVDGAVRYDYIRVKGRNFVPVANPAASNPSYGGLDDVPGTLYDNFAVTYRSPYDYRFSLDYLSFSGAVTYEFDNNNGIYVRYSQGKKSPDLAFFQTYDTVAELENQRPVPQSIQQVEFGYKLSTATLRLTLTPFYSKLTDVGAQEFGNRQDGTTYSPPVLFSSSETYGIEVEGDVDFANIFNLRTALTFQKATSSDFAFYNFGAPGEVDDVIVQVPDGDTDNTPKILASSTLTMAPADAADIALTWRYLGDRPANRLNAFDLPGFSEFNLNATYRVTEQLTINATVNNLFNQKGVLSFTPAGSLLNALNRQNLTPGTVAANPNQLFSILQNQPRSMYLTVGYRF